MAAAAVTGFVVAAASTYLIADQIRDGQRGSTRAGAGTTASPGQRSSAVTASPAAGVPEGRPETKTPATESATCLPVTYKLPTGPASCESKKDICAIGAPYYIMDINRLCGGPPTLQRVNIISEPSTGGDPSVFYCVAWTGSASDTTRDGVLLMNAPGVQCGADLVNPAGTGDAPGEYTVFYDTEQDCTPLHPGTRQTYPAVLDYSGVGDQEAPTYVCLSEHLGA